LNIDHPTVSGNPTIRIDEDERAVAFRDHPLETLKPGAQTEVRLQIASQSVATQLLAVALQQVKEEGTISAEYIGIASTNIAFMDPVGLDTAAWIESLPTAGDDPLDNPGTGNIQISASFTLKMVGDVNVAVQGISFRHARLVSHCIPLPASETLDR
jgi:hypothetical protein